MILDFPEKLKSLAREYDQTADDVEREYPDLRGTARVLRTTARVLRETAENES